MPWGCWLKLEDKDVHYKEWLLQQHKLRKRMI